MAKNKKLIVLIVIVAVAIALLVVLSAVFSVQKVYFVVHDIDGKLIDDYTDAPTSMEVLSFCQGKNIIFLSKDKLLQSVNDQYSSWHAFNVQKSFPNQLEIHIVRRVAVCKFAVGAGNVYLDCFGYVCEQPQNDTCIDITSAFDSGISLVETNVVGSKFVFKQQINNDRLDVVIESLRALWSCYVEYDQTSSVIGAKNVFTFDQQNNLVIKTKVGATIEVQEPSNNLRNKLIKAFSVYYSPNKNLQQPNGYIQVLSSGEIITR